MMSFETTMNRTFSFDVLHEGTLSKGNSVDNLFRFDRNDSVADLLTRLERITSTSSLVTKPMPKGTTATTTMCVPPKDNESESITSNPWDISLKNVEPSPIGQKTLPEKIVLESSILPLSLQGLRDAKPSSTRTPTAAKEDVVVEDDDEYAPLPLHQHKGAADASPNGLDDEHEAFRKAIATLDFTFPSICDSPSTEGRSLSDTKRNKRTRTSTSSSCWDSDSSEEFETSSSTPMTNAKRRRRHKGTTKTALEQSMTLMGPNLDLALRYQQVLKKSTASQKALEEWDRKNGLPRSHCQTMVNSSRSRKQLQSGLILPKWNGKPLLDIPGATVIGLHSSRQLLSGEES